MKIGILTGGGDCPGLNAVIRGATVRLLKDGHEVVGLRDGWKGLLTADEFPLTREMVEDIHREGGTMLGSSRTNVYATEDGPEIAKKQFKAMGLDALIATGGEDTLGVATKLTNMGLPVVGCPKTIDNDLSATDVTVGFDTSINIITEELDRLHTTAKSHHRIIIAEIMGRHAGWMTLYGGMAGGAHVILIPEEPMKLEKIAEIVKTQYDRLGYLVIAASEGFKIQDAEEVYQDKELDSFGHARLGGVGKQLENHIKKLTGLQVRSTVLGYIQRGGRPSASDRVNGTRLGVLGAEMVLEGKFGYMAAVRGTEVIPVPIGEATGKLKTVDPEKYRVAKLFFT
jgi:ATP-dependent phosphofructokinase / diphosphate-dependent phosphofructokinase